MIKLTPHVSSISFLLLHFFDVCFGSILVKVPMGPDYFDNQVANIFSHHFGITAHVKMGTLDNEKGTLNLPYLVQMGKLCL
jgi:hypothetical protein